MTKKLDAFESEMLEAFDQGALKTIALTTQDLSIYKAAASATFIKEKRINIRLSTPDLMDIQARALEEGLPYQTFIASILHKFVTGRFVEKPSQLLSDPSH